MSDRNTLRLYGRWAFGACCDRAAPYPGALCADVVSLSLACHAAAGPSGRKRGARRFCGPGQPVTTAHGPVSPAAAVGSRVRPGRVAYARLFMSRLMAENRLSARGALCRLTLKGDDKIALYETADALSMYRDAVWN